MLHKASASTTRAIQMLYNNKTVVVHIREKLISKFAGNLGSSEESFRTMTSLTHRLQPLKLENS